MGEPLYRRRWPVLIGAGLLLVAALGLGSRVTLDSDVMTVLPQGNREVADYQAVLSSFRGLDRILVDVGRPGTAFDPAVVAVAESLTAILPESPLVTRVGGRYGLEQLASAHAVLSRHRAEVFSAEAASAAESLLTDAAIAERLASVRRQLVSFPDPVTARMFRADPLGLDQLFLALVPAPTATTAGAQVVDGWLWSADGSHLLLFAEPASTELDSVRGRELAAWVSSAAARARAETEAPTDLQVAHLSRFRAAADNEAVIRADITRTMWLSTLGIALVLVLAFGPNLRVLLVFVPAACGGAVALGALAAVYGRISPLVVGCGSIVLGISVDYGVHLLFHAGHGDGGRAAVRATWRPILVAAGTTVTALLSLQASALPGHRQLGLFAAVGVIAAAAAALLVLPVLLPRRLTSPSTRLAAAVAASTGRLIAAVRRHRRPVAVAVVAVSIAAALAARHLEVETDLARFNAMSPAATDDARLIGEVWGSPLGQVSVVVTGPSLDAALDAASGVQTWLAGQGDVASVQTIAGLVPDRATQAENRVRWQQFWSPARVADVRARLDRALAERGFAAASFAPFWEALAAPSAGRDLSLADFADTPLADVLATWVDLGEDGVARVLVRCAFAATVPVAERSGRLRAAFPAALVADGQHMVASLSAVAYRELVKMSVIAFVVVVGLVVPFSRGPREGVVLGLCLLVTFLWSLGLLAVLGEPVNMMSSLLAIFVFGLVDDYVVFLLHADEERGEHPAMTVAAVLVAALTTLIGFAALMVADHPSLVSVGTTTVVGVTAGLVAALVLVPLLGRPVAPTSS